MTRKRIIVVIIASVAGLFGGGYWLGLPNKRIAMLQTRYEQVAPGMSFDQVIRLMGREGMQEYDGAGAWWNDARLAPNEDLRIRRAIRYPTQTFFLPVTFEISFDANGKVVGRHRFD